MVRGRGVSTAASSHLYLCAGSNAVRGLRICKVQVVAVTESTAKGHIPCLNCTFTLNPDSAQTVHEHSAYQRMEHIVPRTV